MCFMRLWNTQRVQIQKKKTVNAQTRAGDDLGETVESCVSLVEKSSVGL